MDKAENLFEKDKRKTFLIFESALACVLFILFNFVFSFGYGVLPASIRGNMVVSVAAQFLVEFLFAFAAWVVAKSRGIELIPAAGTNKKVNGKIFWYGFLISVVTLIFFSSLTETFSDFLYLCGYTSITGSIDISNVWVYLAYVVVLCIAPAIFEELLFRGVILSGFKEYGARVSIVISALVFMLMHGNPDQTIHQFIIGLVVGYMFFKSGNLWLGVIVHFFNNFIAVTELFLFTIALKNTDSNSVNELLTTTTEEVVTLNPWISLLIEFIIALIVAYIGYKLVRILFNKICKESDRINGINREKEELLKMGETATISVDGEAVETTLTVEGEPSSEEVFATETSANSQKQKREPISVACMVMFGLSGLYLVVEWILALISGF